MIEQSEVLRVITEIIMGVIGFFAISTLSSIKKSIDEARKSVDELNLKVAKIIEKTAWHEKTIEIHDERIRVLETTKENK